MRLVSVTVSRKWWAVWPAVAVVARLEFGEAATDLHLVLGRLLPEVGHHLRVDFPCDQAAVTIEDADGLVLGQIAAQVLHHLAREVVEPRRG